MSQPFIDFAHVKEHASFEQVLNHYRLTATGRGAQRTVSCPFHRERRPSCKIELDKKIWHCFGCGAKGNILEFVAKMERSDLRGAALKIAEICSISPAPPKGRSGETRRRRQAPEQRVERADVHTGSVADDTEAEITDGPVNPPLTFELKLQADHLYLKSRGLSAEVVAQFGLGYCNRGMMKGRVCIPVHNAAGEVIAYAGRWADQGEPPPGKEKYRLPPKFQKSRVLFNLHRIPKDAHHVVLVEGYWSVFRLHALGVPVAGLMGSSISPAQIELLRERDVTFVTLLMDGDEAGLKARERLLPQLARSFFVSSPKLPEGEKPDTLDEDELVQLVADPPTS